MNEDLEVGISTQQGDVVIVFGAYIDGLQLSRAEALALADIIKEQAMLIEVGEID